MNATSKPTQNDRILEALRDRGTLGMLSSEFVDYPMRIFKYSSRIAELRAMGHIIDAERVKGTLYRYVLKRDAAALDRGELGLVL